MDESQGRFRVGDRIEWIGSESPTGPKHGERGWVIDIDPMDDVIIWDSSAPQAGNFFHPPNLGEIRFVRHEADPKKRLSGDPHAP